MMLCRYPLLVLCTLLSCSGMAWASGPIDTQATPETKALFRKLRTLAPHKLLFGHQDANIIGVDGSAASNPSMVPDVERATGKFPGVVGFDPKWKFGLSNAAYIRKIKEAHSQGAIITLSWHMPYPKGQLRCAKPPCRSKVKPLLPGGALHQAFQHRLDTLAALLQRLRKPNGPYIPVLLRLFHEHNGDWFWWSASTQREFVALWRFTVRYLRDQKHIHHVLYVYSPHFQGWGGYTYKFPGKAHVDVYGLDCYANRVQSCLK